ncbi:MAG: substrate-binding domain-containing protein [Anaerolineaceae bacterium]|nr:substrate-binding domain-containing protein [Anaerolineaceae bacterium]
MNIPRTNWVLFISFIFISLGVLIAALVSPVIRQYSAAPLRDLVMPPPAPIVVTLLYSTEKADWLNEVTTNFYATNPRLDGRPIKIEASELGSREIVLNILDEKNKPILISPASTMQISMLQDLSTGKFGHPLVDITDRSNCRPVLNSPLVLVAWRERAEALWGPTPGADLWKKIHDAVQNPKGWAAYNHPDWGYVKFGQTNPLTSNSGFMTILLMTDYYFGKASGLTSNDILSNDAYKQWFLETENTISKFGDSTGTYMNDMIAYGPSVYDFITVYEATAISQANNALGRDGAIHIYYPPATVMSDHPFCVLQADWVTPEQAQAANLFVNYLLSRPAQELALTKYGFRPTDPSIALDIPGSPFGRYAANGIKITLPPLVQLPPGDVLNTLLDFWTRNVNH